jgi:transcriptional regulator with XRE-family HTH domain
MDVLIEQAKKGLSVFLGKEKVGDADLAKYLNVSRSQVGRWKKEEAKPRKENAEKIFNLVLFNIKLETLMYEHQIRMNRTEMKDRKKYLKCRIKGIEPLIVTK